MGVGAVVVLARAAVPSKGLTWEGPHPSSLVWLLTILSSSQVVELRASVLCWLLAGNAPHFLASGFSVGQLIIGQLASLR